MSTLEDIFKKHLNEAKSLAKQIYHPQVTLETFNDNVIDTEEYGDFNDIISEHVKEESKKEKSIKAYLKPDKIKENKKALAMLLASLDSEYSVYAKEEGGDSKLSLEYKELKQEAGQDIELHKLRMELDANYAGMTYAEKTPENIEKQKKRKKDEIAKSYQ